MEIIDLPDKLITTPCSILVAGSSMSGKSTFCRRLFNYQNEMFSEKPARIIYCYKGSLSQQFTGIDNVECHYGLPSLEVVNKWIDKFRGKMFVLCLDDLMIDLSQQSIFEELTTRLVHHSNICLIVTLQNIFQKGKTNRTSSINAHYLVLMRTMRDRTQIRVLGTQIFGKAKSFMEVYSDAVDKNEGKNYPYLFVNCHPSPTVSRLNCQLFCNIFPDESPLINYRL
jgi:GTPase SAR1 family protein